AGHRGYRARDLQRFVEGDVADQLARAVGLLDPLLAHVDHGSSRLEPVTADELGTADRGNHDVGPADRSGQIAGPRMGDRYRAVPTKQEKRHRLADDVRPADDDRVEAAQSAELLLKQNEAAERSAGHEAVQAD